MLRKLWTLQKGLEWDEPISEELSKEWRVFFEETKELNDVEFFRCTKPDAAIGNPSLIIFSDASQDAYGAVAYARWKVEPGKFESRIMLSKNRIAPMKTINIVRLELAGAVISKRLRVTIEEETRYSFDEILHIVDSEVVKAMIGKESYGFNTYTANRLGEIQSGTNESEWYWISREHNISDWITHGKRPSEINRTSEWQLGPKFLSKPISEWPISNRTNIIDLPERIRFMGVISNQNVDTLASRIDVTRFSSLDKLLRVTEKILWLYQKFQTSKGVKNDDAEKDENLSKKAEKFWILEAQREIKERLAKKELLKHCPRIEDDVVVVGGRTERWMGGTWNAQSFVLLPYNHPLSQLIVSKYHNVDHLGVSATVAKVRAKYWILNVHKLARRTAKACVICPVKYKRLEGQIMGNLPIERIKPSPPFQTTGIDFFGPYQIRGEVQKRVRGKCFGVIFTCFVSRAVHCDITTDYSTDALMSAIRRFSSIRGWPKKIHSDQGSQLVSASKELKEVIKSLDGEMLERFGHLNNFEWSFSPPDAPWMNGVTESLVKSVKRAINTAVGSQVMSYSELQTVMFEAAQLVNQRPIGRHPTNPDEGAYLCPNDLLLGRSTASIPQGPFLERTSNKYRFDFLQKIVDAFWRKWTRSYFPSLLIRQKWHTEKRNVCKGDVVVVQDSNVVRGEWRLALVTEVYPGSDGRVRRVLISYKNINPTEPVNKYRGVGYTSLERPVHKLIVIIPSEDKEDS